MKKLSLFLPFMILLGMILGCGAIEKKPEWQKAKVLAENLDHPAAIAADENSIYYITGGTLASLNEGTSGVWKMPFDGGQPVQLFKGHYLDKEHVLLPDFFVLAMDEKYVYWSSGAIWRTPKTGGESQKITDGSPTEWAIDDAKIYWHNFGGENSPPTPIYVADKNGGEAKAFSDPVIISGIADDKDFIYWAQSDGIYQQSKTGGEKSKVYSAPENQNVSGLISDQDNFYFTEGNGRNVLFKISKNGGKPVKLASAINHANKFYAGETHVYFIADEGSFGSSLNKVSKNGGEIIKIDSGFSSNFTVGKNKIFVTDISKIYSLEK